MAAPRQRVSSRKINEKTSSERRLATSENVFNKDDGSLQIWCPSTVSVFLGILTARLVSAFFNHITDCDETFNYWEPMHMLMYGRGFQTWEYSPLYALRSYMYILLHAFPVFPITYMDGLQKIHVFYMLRVFLGIFSTLCEVYFYRCVRLRFGSNIARLVAVFLIFGSGMYISTTAFLPSTCALYMTLTSMAAWYQSNYAIAILSTAASSILGWPFAAIIGLPIAIDIILREWKIFLFIKWSLLSLLLFLVPTVYIDSFYYGKLVIAPLNIVFYNIFTEHGPNLYGTEAWTFYFLNGFLNFNVVFVFALLVYPLTLLTGVFVKQKQHYWLDLWIHLSPMYLWILVFFTRPHKEERFLFPIYPLLCLCAAVSLDSVQKLYYCLFSKQKYADYTKSSRWLLVFIVVPFVLMSISRTLALYKGYHAPLTVYSSLQELESIHTGNVNVCVGKEWHRFPSSYFLPNPRWNLQFIKSEFKGQLPKPYASGANATRVVPKHMNDMNREEPSRYVDISTCDFLVDLDVLSETKLEPRYSLQKQWRVIKSEPFLDAGRSSRFYRSFYIPYFSEKYCQFVNYNLLERT